VSHKNQADRVLARLREGPATTWDIGPALGILCPTRRIFELRKTHQITSTETWKGRTRIVTYRLAGQGKLWEDVA
jgi:hypothetical protein